MNEARVQPRTVVPSVVAFEQRPWYLPEVSGGLWAAPACLFALTSGVLMAVCYQPFNLHYLAWFALVPWLVVLPRVPVTKVWSYGLLVGLGYYGISLGWLCRLSWVIGPMLILWFVLLLGFSFRVARLLMDRFGPAAMIWAVPLAFVGQEVLRSEAHGRIRFAFAAWGYSQTHNLWMAQIASLGGVYMLSFLLVAFNAALAYALLRRTSVAWAMALGAGAGIVLMAALAQPAGDTQRQTVAVAGVQQEVFGYMQYTKMVAIAANDKTRPKFIVMPEHALLDMQPGRDPELQALAELAKARQTYICAAGDARVTRKGVRCPFDNEALLIDPAGKVVLEQAEGCADSVLSGWQPRKTSGCYAYAVRNGGYLHLLRWNVYGCVPSAGGYGGGAAAGAGDGSAGLARPGMPGACRHGDLAGDRASSLHRPGGQLGDLADHRLDGASDGAADSGGWARFAAGGCVSGQGSNLVCTGRLSVCPCRVHGISGHCGGIDGR